MILVAVGVQAVTALKAKVQEQREKPTCFVFVPASYCIAATHNSLLHLGSVLKCYPV